MNEHARRAAGALFIIGGSEKRENDMVVLERFVALAGGRDAKIVVVTAASEAPQDVFALYRSAFNELRVTRLAHVHLDSCKEAASAKVLDPLREADGIFMTGGDQKRLLAMIGATAAADTIGAAWHRGACIAGTSAGASAMSALMLAQGTDEPEPEKGAVRLDSGLGLVHGIVVDQHFAQRKRMPRLLTIVAEHPDVYGIGIDEDTALVVFPTGAIDIIGAGSVTVLDGTQATSNIAAIDKHAVPRLIDIRLHLLPSGTRFRFDDVSDSDPGVEEVPQPLHRFLSALTGRDMTT